MKKITISNLGPDFISIHFVGEQARPFCIIDKFFLKMLLSKEYDEEHPNAEAGNFIMKFVLTETPTGGKIPNWILFECGRLVTPYVVLDKEAFLWLKESVGLQLSREESRTLQAFRGVEA